MSTELTSVLRDVIKRASESNVEGPAAKMKKRFVNCSDEIIVLADCSGSMDDYVGSANMSKWDHLCIALKDVINAHPKIRLIAFNSSVKVVKPADLPPPCGGTALAKALAVAQRWRPRKTIVISDGLPDDQEAAIEAADKLTGAIDTIYCGPDEHPAIEFLRKLSRDTGGIQVVWDGYKPLAAHVRALLPPPSKVA